MCGFINNILKVIRFQENSRIFIQIRKIKQTHFVMEPISINQSINQSEEVIIT